MKCCVQWLGISHIKIDRENHRIFLKGDVIKDPSKVLERLQKKFSKNVELISPKPKPENKQKKEPEKKEQVNFNFYFFEGRLISIFFIFFIIALKSR